jgi:hypothetical protein
MRAAYHALSSGGDGAVADAASVHVPTSDTGPAITPGHVARLADRA